jgi:hypothetical protein
MDTVALGGDALSEEKGRNLAYEKIGLCYKPLQGTGEERFALGKRNGPADHFERRAP